MKLKSWLIVAILLLAPAGFGLPRAYQDTPSIDALRQNGALGFPQDQATVLTDRKNLKLSICSNNEWLYVQPILWNDGDDSLGHLADGRQIGDNSVLCLSLGQDPTSGRTSGNIP